MGFFTSLLNEKKQSEYDRINRDIEEIKQEIINSDPDQKQQYDKAKGAVIYLEAISEQLGIKITPEFLADCTKLKLDQNDIITIARHFADGCYKDTGIISDIWHGKCALENSNSDYFPSSVRTALSGITFASRIVNDSINTCYHKHTQCMMSAVWELYPETVGSEEKAIRIIDDWKSKL